MNIEQIWPEAFATGQPVRLKGKQKSGKFVTAWFQCRDGRTYNLTKQELHRFMPDVPIHSRYRKRK